MIRPITLNAISFFSESQRVHSLFYERNSNYDEVSIDYTSVVIICLYM